MGCWHHKCWFLTGRVFTVSSALPFSNPAIQAARRSPVSHEVFMVMSLERRGPHETSGQPESKLQSQPAWHAPHHRITYAY